nr:polyprotein [Mute swan feces associated sapelovirus 3]
MDCSNSCNLVEARARCVKHPSVTHSVCAKHSHHLECCACKAIKLGGDMAMIFRHQYARMQKLYGCSFYLYKASSEKLGRFCSDRDLHWKCNRRSHQRSQRCCGCEHIKKLPNYEIHVCRPRMECFPMINCVTNIKHASCSKSKGGICCECMLLVDKLAKQQALTWSQARKLVIENSRYQEEALSQIRSVKQHALCDGPGFVCRPMPHCKKGRHEKCERHLGEFMDMCCACMKKNFVEKQGLGPKICKTPLEASCGKMREQLDIDRQCKWDKASIVQGMLYCVKDGRKHFRCGTHRDSTTLVCCECWNDLTKQRSLLSMHSMNSYWNGVFNRTRYDQVFRDSRRIERMVDRPVDVLKETTLETMALRDHNHTCYGTHAPVARRYYCGEELDHFMCRMHYAQKPSWEVCCTCFPNINGERLRQAYDSKYVWKQNDGCAGEMKDFCPMFYCVHPKGSKNDHAFCAKHFVEKPKRQACCVCYNYRLTTDKIDKLREERQRYVLKQGQVTSHQTGTTSNSAEQGSSIVTNYINYYGQEYCMANNPSQQTMDPGQFTQPLTSLASGFSPLPALNSPSVEACGYSDRLMELVAGNSSIITQEAASGAVVAYGRWPKSGEAQSSVDLATRPGASVDRFYTLDAMYWSAGGITVNSDGNSASCGQIVSIPLPGALTNLGAFGQMCQLHYCWRGGFVVHIQANASEFHSGCLLVVAVPECQTGGQNNDTQLSVTTVQNIVGIVGSTTDTNGTIQHDGWSQLPLFPHQYINCRTNNSATIVVPYVNFVPSSFPKVHNIWRILVTVVTPLRFPSGGSPVIPITVSICPLESEFNGLRAAVSMQGVPTFLTPGSGAFGTVLRNAGMPTILDFQPTHDLEPPGRISNLLEMAMVATMCDCSTDSAPVQNSQPSRPYFSVPVSQVENGALWETDITPTSLALTSTTLGRLCRMYRDYRGSIKFNFTATCAKQIKGKILIAYTPPGGQKPQNRTEAMLGTHTVWDLGLQSTICFTVPYVSVSQYREANTDGTVFSYCGWLTVWRQTMFTVPINIPGTVDVLVTANACDDFVLRIPIDTAYYQNGGGGSTSTPQPLPLIDPGTLGSKVEGFIHSLMGMDTTGHHSMALEEDGLQVQQSGATGLNAIETGSNQTDAGASTMAVEPVRTTFSRRETNLENLMSRYHLLGYQHFGVVSDNSINRVGIVKFNFEQLSRCPILRTKYRLATYWRFDLDVVAFITKSDGDPMSLSDFSQIRYQIVVAPPGSVTPTNDVAEDFWHGGNNPSYIAKCGDPPISLRLPFMSLANCYTSTFDGYKTYDKGNYGVNPANDICTLYVRFIDGGTAGEDVYGWLHLYVRPVNVRGYMPRPITSYRTQQRQQSESRGRLVFVSPDPLDEAERAYDEVDKQGPVEAQGPWVDKIKDLFSGAATQVGSALTDGIVESVCRNMGHSDQTVKTVSWVKSIVKWLLKFVCAMTILVRSRGDPGIVAAVSIGLGIDLLTSDPFEYLKDMVLRNLGFRWIRVQSSDWVKDFNAWMNAAKGLDWLGNKIKDFILWLKKVLAKSEEVTDGPVSKIPKLMREWDEFEADRGSYRESTVLCLANRIMEAKHQMDEVDNVPQKVVSAFMKYFDKATKFVAQNKHRKCEPIALLVHGSPGSGKSLVTECIGRALSKLYGGAEPFSVPPASDHMDGYNGQPVAIMDDLGQNPDGEDCNLLCQMISCVDFKPPMADLSDKGVNFTTPFVLASTNHHELRPPTISDPNALARRFYMDCDLLLQPKYTTNGFLDVESALTPCDHAATNFKKCCPLICGKAVKLADRKSQVVYTVDETVSMMWRLYGSKSQNKDLLEALFQSPVKGKILQRKSDFRQLPADLVPVLRNNPDERVLEWMESEGFLLPPEIERVQVERHFDTWHYGLVAGVTGLGILVILAGVIYSLTHLWRVDEEGAYSGQTKAPLRPPTRRVVQVQAPPPDLEFAASIRRTNVITVKSANGSHTALGVYNTWVVMAKHTAIGPFEIEGQRVEIEDQYDLTCPGGSLELTCLKFKGINQFKDIRKFFVDSAETWSNVILILKSENYDTTIPLSRVYPYGTINLEGETRLRMLTYNYPTKAGFCGGILVKAGRIIGLHVGGTGIAGFAALLKKDYFVHEQAEIVRMSKTETPVKVPRKTRLQPSMFAHLWEETKQPAALTKNDPRLEADLDKVALGKYKGNVPKEVIEKALPELRNSIDVYVERIKPIMPPNVTEPLSMEDVVYGIESLEGLDLNTSAGFPFVRQGVTKRHLIRGRDCSRLVHALDLYGPDQPYVTYMKDELRPLEKVRTGKTRLIECSSVLDTVRMKMNLGRLFQTFHKNPGTVTGSAVGCNPDEHWSRFVGELGEDNFLAFDYSNYDASLNPIWFWALEQVLIKLGYDEKVIHPIIQHVCNSRHIYGDIEFDVEGGMPSGCSGTSIFNSIINNLIILTLAQLSYKGIDLFQLKIIAYGDDVLVTYPYPLDGAAFVEAGKIFGLTMTPPDKSDTFKEGSTIFDVTFLKRSFKPDEVYPWLWHPVMPKSELHESLRWTRNPELTQEHVYSVCEMYWHHGRSDYEKFAAQIRSVPGAQALQIPPYEYLRRKWLDLF